MNFNFGEVLTRAWQIVWKYKVLWIFGILAGCARGGGGGNGGGGGEGGFDFSSPSVPPGMERFFQNMADNVMLYILIFIALLCVIWFIAVFLGTVGRIGLIRGAAQADGGAEKLIFGQLFSESMPYFWRMFGLSLIVAVPVLIFVAFVFAGTFAFFVPVAVSSGSGVGDNAPFGFLAFIPLLIGCVCLFVPVMLVVGLIFRQAENAIVLEDMRLFPAISRGWEVFRKNLGPIFLMAIILWVIGIVAGTIVALPIILVVIPSVLALALGNARNVSLALIGVCICLYIPVSMVLNGVLTSYVESVWTLTYRRLTGFTPPAPVAEPPVLPQDDDRTAIARPNA